MTEIKTYSDVFQAGGCLSQDVPTYVTRKADEDLYRNLKSGNFCYILSARQMGKSSLRVRTMNRMQSEGFACSSVDLTTIGSNHITLEQWYYSFIFQVVKGMGIDIDLRQWWRDKIELSPVVRFVHFFEEIALDQIEKNIIIFIDEIDSVLSLNKDNFSHEDFFASIRSQFNLRASNPVYRRINFVIMGVATLNDLMKDHDRTPFNVGVPIHLDYFTFDEATPLLLGFDGIHVEKEKLLAEILFWTGGQPVLTQMICKDIADNELIITDIPEVVKSYVDKFFFSDRPIQYVHNLSDVRKRILSNKQNSIKMLGIYQEIISGKKIKVNGEEIAQLYLKLSGIVNEENGNLVVANRIYARKFNKEWVVKALERIDRPFAAEINRWLESSKSPDSALKGQLLKNAYKWAEDRNDLSNVEKEFVDFNRNEERKEKEKQRRKLLLFSGILTILLFVSIILGITIYTQNQSFEKQMTKALNFAISKNETNSKFEAVVTKQDKLIQSNIKDLVNRLKSDSKFKAKDYAESSSKADPLDVTTNIVKTSILDPTRALQIALKAYYYDPRDVYLRNILEIYNQSLFYRIISFQNWGQSNVYLNSKNRTIYLLTDKSLMAYSCSGKLLSSKAFNINDIYFSGFSTKGNEIFIHAGTKVFKMDLKGRILNTFDWPSVKYIWAINSPIQDLLLTNSTEEGINLRDFKGTKIQSFVGHKGNVLTFAFSQDGKSIITGSDDKTAILWNLDGTILQEFKGHKSWVNTVALSHDFKYILTGSEDKTARLWSTDGELLSIFKNNDKEIRSVAISPNNQFFATGSQDGIGIVQDADGKVIYRLLGHKASIEFIKFSDDGKYLLTGSDDKTIRIWNLYKTFEEIINEDFLRKALQE